MIMGALPFLRQSLLPREAGSCAGLLAGGRHPALRRQRRQQHAAQASKKPPEQKPVTSGDTDDPAKAKRDKELRALLALLVRHPGIYGTAAVVLGYCLHTPALGNFHWDAGHAVLGLKCALPVALLDTLLMLPNYAPTTTMKQVKIKVPRAVAEKLASRQQGAVLVQPPRRAESSVNSSISSTGSGSNGAAQSNGSSGAAAAAAAAAATAVVEGPATPVPGSGGGGEELVEIEQNFPVAAEQPPLLAALYRLQMEKAASNAALGLGPLSELALLLTHHLASEMLWRAVVLVAACSWASSLLLLVGADDYLFVNFNLDTTQVGAALAVAMCAACGVGVVVQREVYPLRLVEMLEQAASQRGVKGEAGERKEGGEDDKHVESKRRLSSVLSKMRDRMTRQRRWSLSVEAAREGSESILYSAAFLLTGNLLASYAAAVANDLLFSLFQRMRQRQAEKEQVAALERLVSFSSTVAELRASKVSRLQPSKTGSNSGDSSGGSSSGSSEEGAEGGDRGGGSTSVEDKAGGNGNGQAHGEERQQS